jgi:hypothetical protein
VTLPDLASRGSIVAPAYVGYRATRPGNIDDLMLALRAVASSVPSTVVHHRTMIAGSFPKNPIAHLRVVEVDGVPDGVNATATLLCRQYVPNADATEVQNWRIAVKLAEDDQQFAHALPAGLQHVRISTLSFRVRNKRLEAAPELALARFLLFQTLRALDPNAIVVGAPQTWDEWYWPTHELVDTQQTATANQPTSGGASQEGRWAPDPSGRHELRYYDGTRWTEHVMTNGQQTQDPIG